MPTSQSPHTEPLDPTMSDRLHALRRRKGIALFAFFTVLAFYIPFVLGLPDLYRSSATVLVQGQLGAALGSPSAPNDIDGRLQIIKREALSRARLTELANRFDLYPSSESHVSPQRLADLMQRDIKVEVLNSEQADARTNAVAFTVSYVGRDPEVVADVANSLAAFYLTQNMEMRSTQTSRTTEFLGQQLAETKKRLNAQESRLRTYTRANLGALPEQTEANVAKLQDLNAQLRQNGDEQVRLMERRQTLQGQIAAIGVRIAPDDRDPTTRLTLLKGQLADLRTRLTDTHPDVIQAAEQVRALERTIAAGAASRGASPEGLSPKGTLDSALAETNVLLQQAVRQSNAIRATIATYDRRIENAPGNAAEFQIMTSDYATMRDQHDALLARYDQARLAERADSTSQDEFRVLDAAIPMTAPVSLSRIWLVIMGVIAAMILAVAAVLARDLFDTSFRSVDDLRAYTGVDVLGSIPVIATRADRVRSGWRTALATGAGALVLGILALGAFRLGHVGEPVVRLLLRLG